MSDVLIGPSDTDTPRYLFKNDTSCHIATNECSLFDLQVDRTTITVVQNLECQARKTAGMLCLMAKVTTEPIFINLPQVYNVLQFNKYILNIKLLACLKYEIAFKCNVCMIWTLGGAHLATMMCHN